VKFKFIIYFIKYYLVLRHLSLYPSCAESEIKFLRMADSEQKADALIAEAVKKMSSKGFFGNMFGQVQFHSIPLGFSIIPFYNWTFCPPVQITFVDFFLFQKIKMFLRIFSIDNSSGNNDSMFSL
jgi:hypothetical protein